MKDKRLRLIEVLLKYIIIKERQEERFMNMLNDETFLFDINISPKVDKPYFRIANAIGITDEESVEKIYRFLDNSNIPVNHLVENFIKKYNI